jgi:hypothetical protein
MKKIAVALSLCLSASVAGVVAQQSSSPVTEFGLPTFPAAVQPLTNLLNKALKKTYIAADGGSQALPGGFTVIHAPLGVTCPGGGTCTIEVHQNVQVAGSAGGAWAICSKVDGAYLTNPSCPFLGRTPSDGSFEARSFVQTGSGLAAGAHVVVTEVYTSGAATRYNYEITYRIYKP